MKTILISILSLMSSLIGYTQPYQSVFGKNATTWSIEWSNLNFGTSSYFYVAGDTIINSLSYKAISINTFGATKFFLREDTLTGRVWLVDLDCYLDTVPKLVADLSLRLGDTFNIASSDILVSNPADSLIFVDSVYFVQAQKRIRFASPPSASSTQLTEPITFIEGIGSNYTLLWVTDGCDEYLEKYLLCVFKDSVEANYTNQRFNGECSPIFASIPTLGIRNISISPNPARDYALVQLNQNITTDMQLKITDAIGRVVKNSDASFIGGSYSINTSLLTDGIYFITLRSDNVSQFSGKLCISK